MDKQSKGRLYILSAPSGTGKSTLCSMLINKYNSITYSISYTTRQPRYNEVDGKDYFFTDVDTFKKMIEKDEFLEWAEVHNNFYGTSKLQIENTINQGKDVILDIDVQGALQIKEILGGNAVYIFIATPSIGELKSRLIERGTDTPETIEIRLNNAKKEIEFFKNYDYLIINDKSENAFKELETIYLAEKLRANRYANIGEFISD